MARTAAKKKGTETALRAGSSVALGIEFDVPSSISPNDALLIPKSNPHYVYQDFTFDVAMDVKESEIPLMVGLPSVGKTSFPKQLAALVGMPLYVISCDIETTVGGLLGSWKLIKGETVWIDGPLTRAMRLGYWVVLDEIDYADSTVLGALNRVLEPISASSPDRSLILTDKDGEVVIAHPNFRIFATSNTVGNMQKYRRLFPNARPMNVAFLDRMNIHKVTFMSVAQETTVMAGHFGFETKMLPFIGKFAQLAADCRVAFENEEIQFIFTTRRLKALLNYFRRHKERHMAAGLSNQERILEAAQRTIFTITNENDAMVISGHIKRIFI